MEATGYVVLVGALVVIGAFVALVASQRTSPDQARHEYQEALSRLRVDPSRPELRAEALRLGRRYANRTRNRKGVSLLDEATLTNDIASAAAGAPAQRPPHLTGSTEERLSNLVALRASGFIEEREYQERRRRILDGM